MKKQEKEKLSHFMCFKCHEVGHLANSCPNKEKLKLMKEEERLKHVKCFKCRTWGHLTSMCPTKQLVKQQVKPQLKPLVEEEKKPQLHDKSNHEDGGDSGIKKKIRRGGRARHPMLIQDAKMMSKTQERKSMLTSSASSVEIRDTLPLSVLPSLRRRLKQSMRGKAIGSTP